ncbi:MAG: c-type cytochrome [Verrucomicrobiales bacterium]|nr:c-type cytochrome [Verrucomicrobiales bacterium]
MKTLFRKTMWGLALLLLHTGCSVTQRTGGKSAIASKDESFLNFHLYDGGGGMVLPPKVAKRIRFAESSERVFEPVMHRFLDKQLGIPVVDGRMTGILPVQATDGQEVYTFGCAVCHSGKAAGVFVPGLGNKTFDTSKGGKMLRHFVGTHPDSTPSGTNGQEFSHTIGSRKNGNQVRGTVDDVLVFDKFLPDREERDFAPNLVKIPAVWDFESKMKTGLFCDGLGNGLGWFGAVPWAAGQSTESLRRNRERLEEARDLFFRFEPPPYPFEIDRARTEFGQQVFSENCMRCHGTYPGSEPPNFVPVRVVKTDDTRLQLIPGLGDAIDHGPTRDLMQRNIHDEPGYIAPRLRGIWSRFPYLHNGSVPSLAALLTPPDDRPVRFSVRNAGEAHRFDPVAVGLTEKKIIVSGPGNRNLYDTRMTGQSNEGHAFGTRLSQDEKTALIEYLKTL